MRIARMLDVAEWDAILLNWDRGSFVSNVKNLV
jgi:hypothetical protein